MIQLGLALRWVIEISIHYVLPLFLELIFFNLSLLLKIKTYTLMYFIVYCSINIYFKSLCFFLIFIWLINRNFFQVENFNYLTKTMTWLDKSRNNHFYLFLFYFKYIIYNTYIFLHTNQIGGHYWTKHEYKIQ